MFGPGLQMYVRRIAETIVRPLAALGLTPNMATLLGLLFNGVAAATIATGNLRIGGVILLFAGAFDMVDGALARVRNQKTTFGAFFDSTLDRFSEGIVLLGVIVFALTRLPASPATTWLVALTYIAGLSSLMVSYIRARAEGLGLECKSGLMARPERVLLLAAGLEHVHLGATNRRGLAYHRACAPCRGSTPGSRRRHRTPRRDGQWHARQITRCARTAVARAGTRFWSTSTPARASATLS